MSTIAETIAARFQEVIVLSEDHGADTALGTDPHVVKILARRAWLTPSGEGLDKMCQKATRALPEHNEAYRLDRYTFSDGSAITISNDGWDIGYAGCWCWMGTGHTWLCEALTEKQKVEDARA